METRRTLRAFSIAGSLLALAGVSALPAYPQQVSRSATTAAAALPAQNPVPRAALNSEEDAVLRVDTNLITIPASVMDRVGRYITDLHKNDFQVFEDGAEQEVAVFEPVEQPFTILFLLDTSSSMTPYLPEAVRAANVFVERLRPDDRLIAASFYQWVDVLFSATRVGDLRKGIKLKPHHGSDCSTLIYDAVADGLKRMKKIPGRKAIVLFSDGVGAAQFATARGTLHDAEEQDALIYTVQFGIQPSEPPRYVGRKVYLERVEEINGYMRDLARKTGGRHYQIENVADLGKTFGAVADELRRQYNLGYYPKQRLGTGQARKIKVKVRDRQDLAVQARESYLTK